MRTDAINGHWTPCAAARAGRQLPSFYALHTTRLPAHLQKTFTRGDGGAACRTLPLRELPCLPACPVGPTPHAHACPTCLPLLPPRGMTAGTQPALPMTCVYMNIACPAHPHLALCLPALNRHACPDIATLPLCPPATGDG